VGQVSRFYSMLSCFSARTLRLLTPREKGAALFQQKCLLHVPDWARVLGTTLGPVCPTNYSGERKRRSGTTITNGLYDQSSLAPGFTMPGWKYTLSSNRSDQSLTIEELAQQSNVLSERPRTVGEEGQ